MVAQVVGIRKGIDFTADDGRHICGSKLYVLYQDDKIEGVCADSVFCRSDIDLSKVEVGKNYRFLYEVNFSGRSKLMAVEPVD